MDSKNNLQKPKLAVHGQIKEITMGVGSIESENEDSVLNYILWIRIFFFIHYMVWILKQLYLYLVKIKWNHPDLIIRFDELNQDFEKVNQFKITPCYCTN